MMDNFLKVKDNPGLYRDPVSKAIVINDPAARKNYHLQRNTLTKSLGATEELKKEINNMKSEMDEIKSILTDIVSHLKKTN